MTKLQFNLEDRITLTYLSLYLLFHVAFVFFALLITSFLAPNLFGWVLDPQRIQVMQIGLILLLVFFTTRSLISCFIGWKWTSSDFPRPRVQHWVLSYLVCLGDVAIISIFWFLFPNLIPNFETFPEVLIVGDLGGALSLLYFIIGPIAGPSLFIVPMIIFLLVLVNYVLSPFLPIIFFYIGRKSASSNLSTPPIE